MISIKVRSKGLAEFIAANEQAIKAIDNGDFTTEFAKTTVRRAKYRGPRKTGRLIRGIRYKMNGPFSFTLECSAQNEAGEDYPAILEFGLSRYIKIGTPESPRVIESGGGKTAYLPFMRWAIWRTTQEAKRIMKKTITKHYK